MKVAAEFGGWRSKLATKPLLSRGSVCCRELCSCGSEIGDELLAVTDRNSANLFCGKEKVQKVSVSL